MRTARLIFQILFFILFWYLLVITAYPLTSKIPVDLFLRSDLLAALLNIISTHGFTTLFLPAIAVLVITLTVGRWFCGWLCPLGSHIDLIDRFKWHKGSPKSVVLSPKNNKTEPRWRKVKFYGLVIFLVLAILGSQMIWFMDPLVLITRSITLAFYPYLNLAIRGTFDTLYNVPLINKGSEPIYTLLKNDFLAFEQPAYLNHLTFFFILLLVLGLTLLTPRFWCRYLCPLGAMLGWLGKISLVKRRVNQEKCIECLGCVRQCRTDAIRDKGKSYLPLECVGCMTCVAVCPTDAVHFGLKSAIQNQKSEIKEVSSIKTGITRRGFIYATAGGLVAIPALKLNSAVNNAWSLPGTGIPIRPPGIINEDQFLTKCIRCGECMKVCPTNGLQPTLLQSGWQGVWSPQLIPRIGYCEYECTLCSQVCPSGAIPRIPLEKKQKTVIGMAYIDKGKCIPFTQPTSCEVCEEMCPVPTKAIEFTPVTVYFKGLPPKQVLQPYVVKERCIGCGICEKKCPIEGSPAIYIIGTRTQTVITY